MSQSAPSFAARGPDQDDVDELRELLDLMAGFRDNDQRARYLLTSNWMRDHGVHAAVRLTRKEHH